LMARVEAMLKYEQTEVYPLIFQEVPK